MPSESQHIDKKSLLVLNNHGVRDLARDVVAFANAAGGHLLIGIEDDAHSPPKTQKISNKQVEELRKRIGELTINVLYTVKKCSDENGGEYIDLSIEKTMKAPTSTTDGQYLIRVGDHSRPMRPEELSHFMTDRAAFNWELQKSTVAASQHDQSKSADFLNKIRNSERVSNFIKQKTDLEILVYYHFIRDDVLTHLGILCIGLREDRAILNTAPIVQYIKYDEREQKVRKLVWDDYALAPWELLEDIWNKIPEWHESYEFPEGLTRKTVSIYDDIVIRELLANALVHRSYTQRGDIFINLKVDRLEIHSPGPLPLGVTPKNILHTSIKRNEGLAKVFYDLLLMEREGSGYDRIYEVLLLGGKSIPVVEEGHDRVAVTIYKKVPDPHIIDFMAKADEAFQLTQKERICLGLLTQHKSFNVMQLTTILNLKDASYLDPWLSRLVSFDLVKSSGRTRGKTFSINPTTLRSLQFTGKTNLKTIEPHRLCALILEDLKTYHESSKTEIHNRIGTEISIRTLERTLVSMAEKGVIGKKGVKRYTRYFYLPESGK